MEQEELKQIWEQYNRKLEQNLKLNEEILRRMNMEQSRRTLNLPYVFEIISLVFVILFLPVILISTIRSFPDIRYVIPGIICILIFFLSLGYSYKVIHLLGQLRDFSQPVIQLQKTLIKLEKFYHKSKKFGLGLIPILGISLLILANKLLMNMDVFSQPKTFLIQVTVTLALCYPTAIWIYKNWYEKRFKEVTGYLHKLEEFEKES